MSSFCERGGCPKVLSGELPFQCGCQDRGASLKKKKPLIGVLCLIGWLCGKYELVFLQRNLCKELVCCCCKSMSWWGSWKAIFAKDPIRGEEEFNLAKPSCRPFKFRGEIYGLVEGGFEGEKK